MKKVNLNNSHLNNASTFEQMGDIYNTYISVIRKYPAFTREEEIKAVELAKKSKVGFDNFVNHNLLLVVKSARHFMHLGLELDDLIQSGNMGLLEAARAYVDHEDYYKKNRFNTYAVWYIRKAIIDAIETEGHLVRRSHDVTIAANKVKKTIDRLNGDTFGLSTEDIANMCGLTPEMVATVFATETSILSMSTPISFDGNNNTNESTLADTIDGGDRADKLLVEEDKKKEIELYLSVLTKSERKIVCMKFGIGEEYEKNDKDIAKDLKTTIYTVNRLYNSAMEKLREAAASK